MGILGGKGKGRRRQKEVGKGGKEGKKRGETEEDAGERVPSPQ